MLASTPAEYIRYTLGAAASEVTTGGSPATGTELVIINDCCRLFENWRGWSFLVTTTAPLNLRLGEPYVVLPDDFREEIAIETNPSLLNNIVLSTWDEILQLRTNSIQGWGGYYRAVVRSEFPETKNLLGYTEAFDNAAWTGSGPPTISADDAGTNAPDGAQIADKITATDTTDSVLQAVAAADLTDGRMYMFSVYLKRDDTDSSTILLRQRGASASVASTESNKNTIQVTWTGAVPTATGTLQGSGISQVRVQSHGDDWYRISGAITWRADEDTAATDLSCEIIPDDTTGTLALWAWGAQLEEVEIKEDPYPTRYVGNAAAYSNTVSAPDWRLSIWPTPTSENFGNFALAYRKRLPTITAETDTIPIPDFCEPLFNELARITARGVHEEDVMHHHQRLESLKASQLYMDTVRQDATSQDSYGQMRGTAAASGTRYRNWGSWVTIPTPS